MINLYAADDIDRKFLLLLIHVVGAVLVSNGKVLACRRASHKDAPGKWEFPGGKISLGETSFQALTREVMEEMGLPVTCRQVLDISDTLVADRTIRLETIVCGFENPDYFKSTDHDCFAWLSQEELYSVDWAEPDIPAVRKLSSMNVDVFTQLSLGNN